MAKMTNHAQYILQSVDKALDVLNLFEYSDSLSLTEVALELGCGKTIAFRLLFTLERRGFVLKQEDGRYSLGIRIFNLGNKVHSTKALIPLMRTILAELTAQVNDTVHLVIWQDAQHVVLLDEVLPDQRLIAVEKAFDNRPAHMTSTGMALLSTRSDEDILSYAQNTLFVKKTENSISSLTQLMNDIIFVREQGYAVNNQLYENGVCSIAVPIIKKAGMPAELAISVSGPAERIVHNQEHILEALRETAARICALPI